MKQWHAEGPMIYDSDDFLIADVYRWDEDGPENAQWIAATPDLLYALAAMLRKFGHYSYGEIRQASLALEKATGDPFWGDPEREIK